ncbi:FCD domain-containing protein [Streptomyces sp. Rer75]|uniref:FCD domain-containing protein n=1 Tax=Streptomyces sp. Rer75 TaxID=2750011 RepID=UPI00211F190B|nr:FCD domain-containing protein [Streptomyces sp. Rer75]
MRTGEATVLPGLVQAHHLGTQRSTNFAIGVGQTRHSSGADSPYRPRRASWVAFHDVIMQASGNRIARGVVRALESQVVNTARYMGRPERAVCVASNRGHRRVYERIAAHDPSGAAEAMFTHITEAWLVRRSAPGDPVRLDRWQAPLAAAPCYGMALGLVSVARPRAPSPYER